MIDKGIPSHALHFKHDRDQCRNMRMNENMIKQLFIFLAHVTPIKIWLYESSYLWGDFVFVFFGKLHATHTGKKIFDAALSHQSFLDGMQELLSVMLHYMHLIQVLGVGVGVGVGVNPRFNSTTR